MSLLNRTELLEYLTQGELEVIFTTALTGQERKMRCTLQESVLPAGYTSDVILGANKFCLEDSGRLNVWDLTKNDWRSFLIENITYVFIPTPEEDNG